MLLNQRIKDIFVVIMYKLKTVLIPCEFLVAYNCVIWVPKMEINGPLKTKMRQGFPSTEPN